MNKKQPKDRKRLKDLFRVHKKILQKKQKINMISVIMFFSNVNWIFLGCGLIYETQQEILLIQTTF